MSDQPRQPPAVPPPRALCCPRCGSPEMRVIRTTRHPSRVSRRRECRRCGRRVTTSERIVGQ